MAFFEVNTFGDIWNRFEAKFPELMSEKKYPHAYDWRSCAPNTIVVWFRLDDKTTMCKIGNTFVPTAKNVIALLFEYDDETDNFIFRGGNEADEP